MSDVPGLEQIRRAPKVLLHDHLDGGLRAATIVELADQTGYTGLPTTDPDELDSWMTRGASRKDLVLYLETFAHTVGVMQTPEALIRVARECAEDLADDGIVYAEVRFAPELHLERDMALDDVVEAVQEGFRVGSEGRPIRVRTLLTAMRTAARSLEIADLAVRWRDRGVCGFDIAGAEAGFPPTRHLDAFEHIRRRELPPDDPRGRGVRAPLDLGSLAALWCGATWPRGPHRRRHRGRARRLGSPGATRGHGARPSRSPGAVSDVERALRGGAVDRGASRSGCSPISASASRSTRTIG